MNPVVSIIVPVYKVEKYLDRCVESIINQTYENLEIILVDDGSPDNCPAMCDEWAKKDGRIKVIHKQNGGLSSARNAGLDIMSGEYVYFIDSDDEIKENTIEELYRTMTENNCDIVMGRYYRVFCEDDVEKEQIIQPEFTEQIMLFDEDKFWTCFYDYLGKDEKIEISINMVISCNKLIAVHIFDNLRFDVGKINEDEFIIHKLISRCEKIGFIDKCFYLYYQTEGSIMKDRNKSPKFDSYEARKDRIKYFSENSKKYTIDAFINCFGDFSGSYLNFRKSNPEFANGIKDMYVQIYYMAKPYFNKLNLAQRVYYSTLIFSPFVFRIMRKLYRTLKRDK